LTKGLKKGVIIKNSTAQNKPSHLKKRLLKVAYGFVGLYLFIWISSSFIASYFIGELLKTDYDLDLTEGSSIRYNPFTSHLTIRDFSITKQGQLVFQLEKGDIEIRLHRLVMKQAYVSEFKLDGLFLAVEQQINSSQVAGIELPSTTEPVNATADPASEPSNFKLIMPVFEFLGGKVAIKLGDDAHEFAVQQFSISDTNLSLQKQSLASRLALTLDNAPIEIDISLDTENNLGEISIDVSLKDYQLTHLAKQLPENIHKLGGLLSIKSSNIIRFADDAIIIHNLTTSIEINALEFEDDLIDIKQNEQLLSISDLQLKLNSQADSERPKIDIKIKQVDLKGGKIAIKLDELEFSNQGQQTIANKISFELNADSSLSAQIAELSIDALASQGQQNNLLFESNKIIDTQKLNYKKHLFEFN
jgi:hypothetical protein